MFFWIIIFKPFTFASMIDSSKHQGLRKQLVVSLRGKGILNKEVTYALEKIPRHWFMDKGLEALAYEDKAYPITAGQTISQPYTVAFQTQLLDISKGQKVLEIGTGSGYQTAVLLAMGCKVYTVERQLTLYKKTKRLFEEIKLRPKKMVFGDGYAGLREEAPFDAVLVTAGAPKVPEALMEQLAIGGRLVIPIGEEVQIMTRFTRNDPNNFNKETFGSFRFVPLLENKT